MRLHETYKCEHCPEFHQVELDKYLKRNAIQNVSAGLEELTRAMAQTQANYQRYFLLKLIIDTAGPPRQIAYYFQKLDENMAMYDMAILDLDKSLTQDRKNEYQKFNYLYDVVKCIKANKRVCAAKWKKAFKNRQEAAVMNSIVDLFMLDPSEQWMEIIDFELQVKPLWFTGSRVYQFPVQVVCQELADENRTCSLLFNCFLFLVDCESKQRNNVLSFVHHFEENFEHHPNKNKRTNDVKAFTLGHQFFGSMEAGSCEITYTGKH